MHALQRFHTMGAEIVVVNPKDLHPGGSAEKQTGYGYETVSQLHD